MRKFLTTICTLLFCLFALSQNTIGLPDIVNYTKQVYSGGAQNRKIKQDKNGILYFANNEGVITFDGKNWKTYPLPNKSIVRTIEFGPDGKLYAGGQDEFGYFSPEKNGQLVYHSLKGLIPPDENSFTDVWEIFFHKGKAFFQTSDKIFQVSGKNCTIYKSRHWLFMGPCGDKLMAQDFTMGLLQFQNGVWQPFIPATAFGADVFITASMPLGHDSTLITTRKHGMFLIKGNSVLPFRSSFLDGIREKNLSGVIQVNQAHIALISNLDGCYIIDKKGQLIQNFSVKEGLQNNNILNIFLDREKNIWLGLDNGIDFIAYNNAIKHIYPETENEGSGYAALIHNNALFMGTSNGLYQVSLYNLTDFSFIKGRFSPITNTKGQVWNLSEVNGELLLGHHDGAYVIKNNTAVPIDNSTGFWNFFPLSNVLPSSTIVTGTYQGINFYNYENGKFINENNPAHFESARFVVIENNTIWAAHPYKGIFKITVQPGGKPLIKQYHQKEGVASVNGNFIYKIRNSIVLTTENGVFEYNATKDVFEPSAFYNKLFKNLVIRYLKEDGEGNVWFVFDKKLGVLDFSGHHPQIIYLPELTNKMVSGFEYILPVNKQNVLVGGEKGFYHINYEQYKKNNYPLQVQITTVKALGKTDSLVFGGYYAEANSIVNEADQKAYKINHGWNTIHFEYASSSFAQQANIEYSYFLQGFDKKWSEFSKKTEKEYTNLPAGKYIFQVKARNNLGNESKIYSFSFTVLPPWYFTWWAYLFYTALFFSVVYFIYRKQKKKFALQQLKFEEEQKQLRYLHQLELEKNEKEIIKLKNEKLEIELNHKNSELASSAMHLLQKSELLVKIKDELTRLKKQSDQPQSQDEFKKIIKTLNDEDKMDKDWEHFSMHFDKVHTDFLVVLKQRYPLLSANELKLCAYLRMNLSSKEIAQLMNISVRGVEISRYRLRKKLQIPTEVNLFDHLISVHPLSNN